MIKEIEKGEIVRIEGREYILSSSAIGGSDKIRPNLILLENTIKNMKRKNKTGKKFKGIKLKIMKGGYSK